MLGNANSIAAEAFANLHAGFAEAIRASREAVDIPVAYDGLKGVAFIDAL
jgi:hypothetical protein